jgi:hypothetical protein
MEEMLQTQNLIVVRQMVNRAARCPWCLSPVLREVHVVEGVPSRFVACSKPKTCGWTLEVGEPSGKCRC